MKTKSKLLVTLLFVVLAISVALFGVSCKKNPGGSESESTSSEQTEEKTAVYYADAGDGEYVVSLKGNEYVLSIAGDYKFGSFTLNGGKLRLIAGDGSYEGTIEGDELSLAYGGKTYVLLEKIARKVTFEGAEVAAQTVMNGMTATKPADPAETGDNVFIGWYTSSDYTELYNFATPVRSDIALYARFALVPAGQIEYTATLKSGNETIATVQTVGGKLFDLPAQEAKDGKAFDGWYLGSSADKLSSVYGGETLTEDTTLYAVWRNGTVYGVSVSETGISWKTTATGAVSFRVRISAPNGNNVDTTVSQTAYNYSFANGEAGEYTVEITDKNTDDAVTLTVVNKKLAKVGGFSVSESGILTYNKVENAQKYLLTVICGNENHNHDPYDNGTSVYFDLSSCDMVKGGIKVTVTAQADGYLSSVSDTFVYDKTLGAVTKLAENDGVLVWSPVKNAMGYVVVIDGEKISVGNDTEYSLKEYDAGSYTVGVYAVAAGYNDGETTEISYNKTSIAAPSGLKIGKGIVSWNAVNGATGYSVNVNGKTASVDGTQTEFAMTAGSGTTEISVAAKDEKGVVGAYSETISVDFAEVTNLRYEGGVLSWNPVYNAVSYLVSVNGGDALELVAGTTKTPVTLTQAGRNALSVAYKNTSGNVVMTKTIDVTAYEIRFETLGGEKVNSVYAAKGDTVVVPDAVYDGYEFAGWYTVPAGAKNNGRRYYGGEYTGNGGMQVFADWTAKKYEISLEVTGGTIGQTTAQVAYGEDYRLPVAVSDDESKVFGGWYSAPNGAGVQYTDEKGYGLTKWTVVVDEERGMTLYAGWLSVVTYELDGSGNAYRAFAGPGISYVSSVKVSETFNEKPVTTIESFADARIVSIQIPDTVTIIADGAKTGLYASGAFQGCSALREISIYETGHAVTPKYASDSGALYTLTYTEDGQVATRTLTGVPHAKTGDFAVMDGTNAIGAYAAASSTVFKVTVPASVTSIGDNAFNACSRLQEVGFTAAKEGETEKELTLGASVFKSCSSLVSVTLPGRVKNIDTNIFASCNKLSYLNISGENKDYRSEDGMLLNVAGTKLIYCPRGREGEVTIPDSVSEIAESAFESCKNIEKITIPAGVETIGKNAFKNCGDVTELAFLGTSSDKPLAIGESAFYGLKGLTSLTLPENLYTLGKNAFGGTEQLFTVKVESGIYDKTQNAYVLNFADAAFASSSSVYYVNEIILGKNVPPFNISGVFGYKVAKVTIDPANTNYKEQDSVLYSADGKKLVFYPAAKAGAFTIPDGVEEIASSAFKYSSGLTSVTIPASVTKIDDSAFANCSKLKSVIFATEKEGGQTNELTIASNAFSGSALVSVAFPDRLVSLADSVLNGCKYLTSVTFGTGLKTIGKSAFSSCTSLQSIVIPEGVTELGDSAFSGCSKLASVVLPSTLEKFGQYNGETLTSFSAFGNCDLLGSVTFSGENENFSTKDGVLYLKKGNKETDLFFCPVSNEGQGGVIVIPSSVTKIWDKAFNNTVGVKEIRFENDKIADDATLSIGKNVFSGSHVETLILPEGMRTIERSAIYSAKYLQSVTIPSTVTLIKSTAFQYDVALREVIFREGGTEPLEIQDAKYSDTATSFSPYNSAFNGCTSLESISFPERTVKIGAYVFQNITGLKSVHIPSTVKTIAGYAFAGCTSLESVTFAANCALTEIPLYAFNKCSSLKTIDLPKGISEIGCNAFSNSGLTSITIPKNVKRLGGISYFGSSSSVSGYTFASCYDLASVTFEEGSVLESIESYAFNEDQNLTAIELPASLKNLGDSLFAKTGIKEIVVPANVETLTGTTFFQAYSLSSVTFAEGTKLSSIGGRAFAYTALTSFAFPETTADKLTLGSSLFANCTALKEVHLSSKVASVDGVFTDCYSIEKVTVADGNENLSVAEGEPIIYNKDRTAVCYVYGDLSETLTIAEGTTEIYDYAFANRQGIKTLILPSSLITIGSYAFRNCYDLETVTFTDGAKSLTKFGNYAFQNCSSLTKIVLPENLTEIGQSAFDGCASLSLVTMGNAVKTIGRSAFRKTTSLKNIEFSSALTTIDTGAFEGSGLTSVTIPASVTTLNGKAFADCVGLTSVTFEEGANKTLTVNANVFNGSSVTELAIPNRVKELKSQAFMGMASLTKVTFGDKVAANLSGKLIKNAFKNCTSLESIEIPEGITEIQENAFQGCSKLSSVKLPSTLKTLGTSTTSASSVWTGCVFDQCVSLTSIDLPDSLTYIGTYTFRGTGLTSVTLPSGIVHLSGTNNDTYAIKTGTSYFLENSSATGSKTAGQFMDCANLETVILPAGLKTIGIGAFYNCPKLTKVVYDGYLGEGSALPSSTYAVGSLAFGKTAVKDLSIEAMTVMGQYAFAESNLESVVFDGSCAVTAIPSYAFADLAALRTVVLPNALKSVGSWAFRNCTSLRSVDLGMNLTSLSNNVFTGSGLETIDLSYVTSLDSGVFNGCSDLHTVVLSEELLQIPASAFTDCTSLESIAFPEKLTQIGRNAFYGSGLRSVTITENVQVIDADAFGGLKNLAAFGVSTKNSAFYAEDGCLYTAENELFAYPLAKIAKEESIVIPNGKSLGSYAFDGLAAITDGNGEIISAVKEVKLPDTLETIPAYAFYNFRSLERIEIPEGVTQIGEYAFANCENLSYVKIPSTLQYVGAIGANYIAENNGYTFLNCTSLKTVDFSAATGLVRFGVQAFAGSGLESIAIPEGVDVISTGMFYECESLKSVTLPSTILAINKNAFYGCTSLESIAIPENVTRICDLYLGTPGISQSGSAFEGCTKLSSVTFLGNKLECFGTGTFAGCTALKAITIPESVVAIGTECFKASGILSIDIPESVTALGNDKTGGTFENCVDLETVTGGEGLTVIGGKTFFGCAKLKTIVLGEKVSTIGDSAFEASGLAEITIRSVAVYGNRAFAECANLAKVTMPNETKKLNGTYIFYNCKSLKTFTIPSNVNSLGGHIFEGSGLTNIHIPRSVIAVSAYAFADCADLETITIESGITSVGMQTFANCVKVKTIYLPASIINVDDDSFLGWTAAQTIRTPASHSQAAAMWDLGWSAGAKVEYNSVQA